MGYTFGEHDGNPSREAVQEWSQSVRLPAEFRFEGNEVYVSRDDQTGDVVLSNRPGARSWTAFFAFMESIDVPDDFMADRPMNVVPVERDIFGEEE